MSRYGRGAIATAAQRAEVVRLAADGMSIRRIADEVFGDPALRGRVERILRAPLPGSAEDLYAVEAAREALDVNKLGTTATIRLLFERRLQWLRERGETASMNELLNVLAVERRLVAMEQLEDHQRLHRARRLTDASTSEQRWPSRHSVRIEGEPVPATRIDACEN